MASEVQSDKIALLITNLIHINMFICVCNAVTDQDIVNAINEGSHSISAVMEKTNAATQCGRCTDEIVELLAENCPFSHGDLLVSPIVYGQKKSANTLCLAD